MVHVDGWLFIDRFSPFLFQVHVFAHAVGIRWYGLAYLLGFVLTVLAFREAVRSGRIAGFGASALADLSVAVPAGVLLGGRLGFVVQHPHELLADPLFALKVWQGGMAFFGGLFGTLVALGWVARRHHVKFFALTDEAAYPAALALAIGRLANFINGELVGRPTGGHWGVVFPGVDSLPRHPSQLYESASEFLLFGALVLVRRRWPAWREAAVGRISFLFLVLYGVLRFLTDFYRDDDVYWGRLSDGQWVSLATALVGLIALLTTRTVTDRKHKPTQNGERLGSANE